MAKNAMLLWTDGVEVEFGLRGIATKEDWQHRSELREQAQRIAHEILQRQDAHAGEGWRIVVSKDGTASVHRLW